MEVLNEIIVTELFTIVSQNYILLPNSSQKVTKRKDNFYSLYTKNHVLSRDIRNIFLRLLSRQTWYVYLTNLIVLAVFRHMPLTPINVLHVISFRINLQPVFLCAWTFTSVFLPTQDISFVYRSVINVIITCSSFLFHLRKSFVMLYSQASHTHLVNTLKNASCNDNRKMKCSQLYIRFHRCTYHLQYKRILVYGVWLDFISTSW